MSFWISIIFRNLTWNVLKLRCQSPLKKLKNVSESPDFQNSVTTMGFGFLDFHSFKFICALGTRMAKKWPQYVVHFRFWSILYWACPTQRRRCDYLQVGRWDLVGPQEPQNGPVGPLMTGPLTIIIWRIYTFLMGTSSFRSWWHQIASMNTFGTITGPFYSSFSITCLKELTI